MQTTKRWLVSARVLLVESVQVYWILLKIMVPALIIVKCLQMVGAVDALGDVFSPVMSLIGLPAVLGVVWATTLPTNILTGIVVFFQIAAHLPLTVEHVTILGTLMLIGHSLPIEGAVARKAGITWWATLAWRVGGALVLGALLHHLYSGLDIYQTPAQYLWTVEVPDTSLRGWALAQIQTLASIFVIIVVLICFLRALKAVGLERWIHLALMPLLRFLGISKNAANVTVIGVALGLSYGAGLLIRDLEQGVMSRRDAYLALSFLGLAHSLIEDTLLVMAIGAELSGILWARLLFAILAIACLARVLRRREARAQIKHPR